MDVLAEALLVAEGPEEDSSCGFRAYLEAEGVDEVEQLARYVYRPEEVPFVVGWTAGQVLELLEKWGCDQMAIDEFRTREVAGRPSEDPVELKKADALELAGKGVWPFTSFRFKSQSIDLLPIPYDLKPGDVCMITDSVFMDSWRDSCSFGYSGIFVMLGGSLLGERAPHAYPILCELNSNYDIDMSKRSLSDALNINEVGGCKKTICLKMLGFGLKWMLVTKFADLSLEQRMILVESILDARSDDFDFEIV